MTSKLNPEQLVAAQNLRQERPPVIPGTNAIPGAWYDKVVAEIERTGVPSFTLATYEFCNIAGVPD
jgi:hypothetical protein